MLIKFFVGGKNNELLNAVLITHRHLQGVRSHDENKSKICRSLKQQ